MTPARTETADVHEGLEHRITERALCTVSLAAVRRNVRSISSRLTSGTRLWAVVKANAYGHDAVSCAHSAIAAGAGGLCVATLSEARQLRHAGVGAPILLMGPLGVVGVRQAAALDVALTITSMDVLDAVEQVASESGSGPEISVHLKIDTGMGRWGISMDAVTEALSRLEGMCDSGRVRVAAAMTHFATADNPDDSTFLSVQVNRFRDVSATVRDHFPDAIAHAANSAAAITRPETHFDAVRCGIAIYGLSPTALDASEHDLAPALSLRSYVAGTKRLAPGQSTGYCRTFIADVDTTVALIPVGYADGIRRSLSNRGEALISGRRHRYAGNVSMDHLSLLVDGSVSVGDEVVLIGRDGSDSITIEEHARLDGTINYEIACGIALPPRLHRSFSNVEG